MGEGLFGTHAPQLGTASSAEGPTRRGQDDLRNLRPPRQTRRGQPLLVDARRQRLSDRRVLGVDGDDLARETHRVPHERSAHDQGFLVRQRQACPALQGRERRRQPHAARNAVEDDETRAARVGADELGARPHQFDRCLRAHEHLGAPCPQLPHSRLQLAAHITRHRDEGRFQRDNLRGELTQRRSARAQAHDVKAPAVSLDDLARLSSYRSGRAQQDDGDRFAVRRARITHQSTARRISTARPR